MELSLYSYVGLGFSVATIYGINLFGFHDYRVLAIFILAVFLLLIDVFKYYQK